MKMAKFPGIVFINREYISKKIVVLFLVEIILQTILPNAANSCDEVKLYHLNPSDQEYTLYISSRRVKIYCHNMDSDNPKVFE